MDSIVLWILTVAGIPALLILVLNALANLRDEFVNQGWVSRNSKLGKQTTRAAVRKFAPVLDAVGITEDVRNRIARTTTVAIQQRAPSEHLPNIDEALIATLKPWVRDLGQNTFRGLSWYVDTMGAVHQRDSAQPSLAQIFAQWLDYLLQHQFIAGVDLLVVPKDGNPILAGEVRKLIAYSHLIVVKGEQDPSRVPQTGALAHPTDFEGLRAFIDQRGDVSTPTVAVAIDDSVTTGRSMMSAIARFNDYVARADLNISPIEQAVTLFRIIPPSPVTDPFLGGRYRVRLHSLLAFTDDDLNFLTHQPLGSLLAAKDRFKEPPSCDVSRGLRS